MSPEDLDRFVSLVRRMEDEAKKTEETAGTLSRGGKFLASEREAGRADGIREVTFQLKALLGMGKLG
jgi:hypothetical protein